MNTSTADLLERELATVNLAVARQQQRLRSYLEKLNPEHSVPVSNADLAWVPECETPCRIIVSEDYKEGGDLNPSRPVRSRGLKHAASCFEIRDSMSSEIAVSSPQFNEELDNMLQRFHSRMHILSAAASLHLSFLQAPTVFEETRVSVRANEPCLTSRLMVVAKVFALIDLTGK